MGPFKQYVTILEGGGSPLCHVTFFQIFDSPLGQFLAGKTSISEQMMQFFEKWKCNEQIHLHFLGFEW